MAHACLEWSVLQRVVHRCQPQCSLVPLKNSYARPLKLYMYSYIPRFAVTGTLLYWTTAASFSLKAHNEELDAKKPGTPTEH
eukprot:1416755-Amphidinium_carterae.1